MSHVFTLFRQQPSSEKVGKGKLSVDRDGQALLYTPDNNIIADLVRARLDFVGADGIMLSGMERYGLEPGGQPKYRYQEWWLVYHSDPDSQ